MTVNFPLILASLTLFTGIIVLIDFLLLTFQKKRGRAARTKKLPTTIEYARAFFPVLIIVFLLRSFVAQPYRVPTGSLEPTVLGGDFILVNQYQYGLHFPVWHKKIIDFSKPQRGQIVLFFYPVNTDFTFVKRVIGLPGDTISYINKVLYINGKEMKQTFQEYGVAASDDRKGYPVAIYNEDLDGIKHKIYARTTFPPINFYNLKVPAGKYFMMGDNRDSSDDSRFWGFVREDELIGRAIFIWMSWDPYAEKLFEKVRWQRIGKAL